jgi:cell surface protein SprA
LSKEWKSDTGMISPNLMWRPTWSLENSCPKKAAISIPMFASYSQTVSMPEYDPYDLDIKLKDKLNQNSGSKKDSIRDACGGFYQHENAELYQCPKEQDRYQEAKDL